MKDKPKLIKLIICIYSIFFKFYVLSVSRFFPLVSFKKIKKNMNPNAVAVAKIHMTTASPALTINTGKAFTTIVVNKLDNTRQNVVPNDLI